MLLKVCNVKQGRIADEVVQWICTNRNTYFFVFQKKHSTKTLTGCIEYFTWPQYFSIFEWGCIVDLFYPNAVVYLQAWGHILQEVTLNQELGQQNFYSYRKGNHKLSFVIGWFQYISNIPFRYRNPIFIERYNQSLQSIYLVRKSWQGRGSP